jgi:purine nucleosidase
VTPAKGRSRIVLDTDIGGDIDDAMALALVLASPELELVAVTTVNGSTRQRARHAQTILHLAGRDDVPVYVGAGPTLSPADPAYPAGYRPADAYATDAPIEQQAAVLQEADLPALPTESAVDFLVDHFRAAPDTTLVAIGPLTNLAMALRTEPALADRIRGIVTIAGWFERPERDWNVWADPVAAALVFDSGISMRVVPLDVTLKCKFAPADTRRVDQATSPVGANLAIARRAHTADPVLHDPLAVMLVHRPELVRWERGRVSVRTEPGDTFGITDFARDVGGHHEVCLDVDPREVVDQWLERVLPA